MELVLEFSPAEEEDPVPNPTTSPYAHLPAALQARVTALRKGLARSGLREKRESLIYHLCEAERLLAEIQAAEARGER